MDPGSGRTRRFSFIGVTTGKSAIMRVFPAWAEYLGLGDVEICGHDFAMHAPPQSYREVVRAIASDPLELGGLVTTHKIDLFSACKEMFDFIDPWAQLCGEVSSLSNRGGLFGLAKDPYRRVAPSTSSCRRVTGPQLAWRRSCSAPAVRTWPSACTS